MFKKLVLLSFIGLAVFAEDNKPEATELIALKARIEWLEKKLKATEAKADACFNIYGADMQLVQLNKTEPPKPPEKEK